MFVGKVCYVTHHYDERLFRMNLELQLEKKKGAKLSDAFIEECLSAFLDCKNIPCLEGDSSVMRMESLLDKLNILYTDFRSYGNNKVSEHPEDAVKFFNKLATDYLLSSN